MARLYANNYSTTLAAAIGAGDALMTVSDPTGLPPLAPGDYFKLTIDDGAFIEIVKVTSVMGAILSISRGEDNTAARAFAAGSVVEIRATSTSFREVELSRNYADYGSSNAYVIDVTNNNSAPVEALYDGLVVEFFPLNSNTGASTANVAGLGAVAIKLPGGLTDLSAGDIFAGRYEKLTYRTSPSTHFELDLTGRARLVLFTTSGTYSAPKGLKNAKVTAVGAGGGGSEGVAGKKGAGGGGGGTATSIVSAYAIGASQSVTVGTGGAGGVTVSTPGSNGGNSIFGALVAASGGAGAGVDAGGQGGQGTLGAVILKGGAGDDSVNATGSGRGGSSSIGGGGRAVGGGAGFNGGSYGGGGGGGTGGAGKGGDGASGCVIVEEYY